MFRKQSGKYYGRGTTDDKGRRFNGIIRSQYAMQNRIPINIRFVWEFEEEIGSPNFEDIFA